MDTKLHVYRDNKTLVVTTGNKVVADTASDDFTHSEQVTHAAFIVRAANSHAVLAEYFHASKSLQMTMGHPDATVEDKHKAEARYKAATTAARAALAAAEG